MASVPVRMEGARTWRAESDKATMLRGMRPAAWKAAPAASPANARGQGDATLARVTVSRATGGYSSRSIVTVFFLSAAAGAALGRRAETMEKEERTVKTVPKARTANIFAI